MISVLTFCETFKSQSNTKSSENDINYNIFQTEHNFKMLLTTLNLY